MTVNLFPHTGLTGVVNESIRYETTQESVMDFQKMKDGSFVHNCYIARRRGEKAPLLFRQESDGSKLIAFLNGYAIIPLEEYKKLKGEDFDGTLIEKADRDLYA